MMPARNDDGMNVVHTQTRLLNSTSYSKKLILVQDGVQFPKAATRWNVGSRVDTLKFLWIAFVLDTLHNAYFGFQQLFFCRSTDMPPLTFILSRVGERTSHMDEVTYGYKESAELGEAFEALWMYHISGNMSETCHHLRTHFRVGVRVDKVVSFLKLRWMQRYIVKKGWPFEPHCAAKQVWSHSSWPNVSWVEVRWDILPRARARWLTNSLDPVVYVDIESPWLILDVSQYNLTICVVGHVVERCIHLWNYHLSDLDGKYSCTKLKSWDS